MEGWDEFSHEMSKYYNVDISVLTAAFEREQQEYYQQTVVWADIHPSQLRGAGVPFKSYDLLKVTVQELKEALKVWATLHTRNVCSSCGGNVPKTPMAHGDHIGVTGDASSTGGVFDTHGRHGLCGCAVRLL